MAARDGLMIRCSGGVSVAVVNYEISMNSWPTDRKQWDLKTPARCPPGTYVESDFNLSSVDDCLLCPVGHACTGSEAQPARCLAGNIAPGTNHSECDKCSAGKYQMASPHS